MKSGSHSQQLKGSMGALKRGGGVGKYLRDLLAVDNGFMQQWSSFEGVKVASPTALNSFYKIRTTQIF